jgi:hypothetical protein
LINFVISCELAEAPPLLFDGQNVGFRTRVEADGASDTSFPDIFNGLYATTVELCRKEQAFFRASDNATRAAFAFIRIDNRMGCPDFGSLHVRHVSSLQNK